MPKCCGPYGKRPKAPTLERIEAMARGWQEIEEEEHALEVRKAMVKAAILREVNAYGEIAPKAKTMRVLRGLAREIQATFPTETTVNPLYARKFVEHAPRSVGKKIFERSVRYTLRPGAFEVFAMAAKGVLSEYERNLFALAVQRRDGAPRVKVVKLKKAKKAA